MIGSIALFGLAVAAAAWIGIGIVAAAAARAAARHLIGGRGHA